MIGVDGLMQVALVAALAAGPAATIDAPLWTPGEGLDLSEPEATGAPAMVVCESGGSYASECQLTCRVVFNFAKQNCSVSCRSGYFACCSCDGGCKCLMDHDEMWPTPLNPPPTPPKPVE